DAAEPFFFGGGDELAVLQQSGCRVVVIAGNPQDIHVSLGGAPPPVCSATEDGRTISQAASSCASSRRTRGPPGQTATPERSRSASAGREPGSCRGHARTSSNLPIA